MSGRVCPLCRTPIGPLSKLRPSHAAALGVAAGAGGALVAYAWVRARARLRRFGRSRSASLGDPFRGADAGGVPAAIETWRDECAVAVDLARQCGAAMVSADAAAKRVEWKGGGCLDPCTATDRDNEALVRRRLLAEFPEHAVVGEEAAAAAGEIPAIDPAVPTWIVDPIDGTQNFFHGFPAACVSIGLALGGRPRLGVVYDPQRDETFVAVRGEGAFLNGERMAVPKSDAPTTLETALVLTDPGYERSPPGIAKLAALHRELLAARTRAIRIVGSTVLSLLWVCAGRADAMVVGVGDGGDSPKPWDWCAAAVFARETGCAMEAIDGRRDPAAVGSAIPGEFDLYAMSCVGARTRGLADAVLAAARSARAAV